MATQGKMKHWQDPAHLVLGLWMVISPWVLQHHGQANAAWNAVIVGILLAALAVSALAQPKAWEKWTGIVLGVWLLISPWILGFSAMIEPMANAVIVGVATAALAVWALATDADIEGWWSPATRGARGDETPRATC